MLIIDDQFNVLLSKNWIIKPYTRPDSEELVSYKDDAMAVHGISMDEINNGIELLDVLYELMNLLSDYHVTSLIGHNFKQFDLPRLKHLFEKFGNHDFLNSFHIEDTLEMCRERLNLPCNKLESVCKHFGISSNDFHRALGDCYATLELFKKLIYYIYYMEEQVKMIIDRLNLISSTSYWIEIIEAKEKHGTKDYDFAVAITEKIEEILKLKSQLCTIENKELRDILTAQLIKNEVTFTTLISPKLQSNGHIGGGHTKKETYIFRSIQDAENFYYLHTKPFIKG